MTSLHAQNFLQFVETVQFFIFAQFHAPEYSAAENYFPGLLKLLFPFKVADGIWHRESSSLKNKWTITLWQ